jgi:arylformamidase
MSERILDLSVRLEPATPVFPNYEPVKVKVLETTEDPPARGRRSLNSSRIGIGMHCGTHMDSPFHFIRDGKTIDQIPLEHCVGRALLIRLSDRAAGSSIDVGDFERHAERLRQICKLVVDTGWRRHWGSPNYFTDHPLITGSAARFLVGCGVHLVGVDMPSVDRPPFEAHLVFLGNNVVIVENLANLDQIRSDLFELIALPLKLSAREASPVRAIAREID